VTLRNLAAVAADADFPAMSYGEDAPPQAAAPPQPLRREAGEAAPFPVEALGSLVGGAAAGVSDMVMLPPAIAAQSALSVASLAVQGHVDVELPYGEVCPTSLFLLSIAKSGDRKSASDKLLSAAITIREDELGAEYALERRDYDDELAAYDTARANAKSGTKKSKQEIYDALKTLGDAPTRPRSPVLTAHDPTIEGLHKSLDHGQPTFGLFADEGGQFVGGTGMSKENVLRTAAGFSGLWDGSAIKRMRAGDGVRIMRGRRVSLHLMMQQDNAARWLSDPVLRDQGLFGRLLVAAPESWAGTRLSEGRTVNPRSRTDLDRFTAAALESLRQPLPYVDTENGVLQPRALPFDLRAKQMLIGFGDAVERELGAGGKLEPVSSLAGKAVTHAARLSAVLTAIADPSAGCIDAATAERGVALTQWYLAEALRINAAGYVTPDIARAEAVLSWLKSDWPAITATPARLFSLPDVYQFGPSSVRDKASAKQAVDILIDHGHVVPVEGAHKVNGSTRRDVFSVRGA
jgi:hypothetical protein